MWENFLFGQSSGLVHYKAVSVAVERCARLYDAKEMQDKSVALHVYARQLDERDLEVWMAEIKLRASVQIGALVRELDRG